jgi:surface antigen
MRIPFRVPLRTLAALAALAALPPSLLAISFTAEHAALAAESATVSAIGRDGVAKKSLEGQRPAIFQSPRPSLILDEGDEIATLNAIHTALQTVGDGGAYVWQRPHGLLDGIIQPTASFKNANGDVCRHLVIRLNSGAYSRQVEGIACRASDGRWSLSG